MVDVSIVIISWNVRDLLRQSLESIEESFSQPASVVSYDVWVVDNASHDGSADMVRECFPAVKLITSDTNQGFAAGNNLAIRSSLSRYILLLNPDTRVLPGAVENLVEFMDANPRAGAAGSLLLNPDGSLQTSCYPFPTLSREFWRLLHLDRLTQYGVYRMTNWEQDKVRQTDVIQGTSLIVRREILDRIGLLDENYFMYTEEVDLCYRIARDGWELWWVPHSKVVHYGGQSTAQVSNKMFLCLYQSKLQFFRKHYGPGAAKVYKGILATSGLARLAMMPLIWLERGEKRKRHLHLAHNYRQLLSELSSW